MRNKSETADREPLFPSIYTPLQVSALVKTPDGFRVQSLVAHDLSDTTVPNAPLTALGLIAELRTELQRISEEHEKTKAALRTFMREYDDDTCIECGEDWPKCECPNGQWWRDAAALLGPVTG